MNLIANGRLTDFACVLILLAGLVATIVLGVIVKRNDRFDQAVIDLSAAANEAGR